MRTCLLFLCFTLLPLFASAQQCLNADEPLNGYFYAGYNPADSTYSDGFYESPNYPKQIAASMNANATEEDVYLIALPDSTTTLNNYAGFKVFLVNNSEADLVVNAEDSRLDIVRQVFYKGKWQNIEQLLHSWCGNSYHEMTLAAGRYWDFTAPCTEGKITAEMRFMFYRHQQEPLVSNSFPGSFNRGQLKIKTP